MMEAVLRSRLKINRHELYVEIHGLRHNPWVVLLHHGLGTTQAWKKQIPGLVQAGYCVLVYDRWGYGRSQKRLGLLSPDFADDVLDLEKLLEEVGPAQCGIVGHSDGGTIGLSFAARHPDRVKSLVVIAAHIYIEEKMGAGIETVRRTFLEDEQFQAVLARLHGENYPAVFWFWYSGWLQEKNFAWDMRQELTRITCPTLVVQGTQDEHATDRQARDLAAAIHRSQLRLVSQAGHMLPQTHADEFNQWLVSFLSDTIIGVNYVQ